MELNRRRVNLNLTRLEARDLPFQAHGSVIQRLRNKEPEHCQNGSQHNSNNQENSHSQLLRRRWETMPITPAGGLNMATMIRRDLNRFFLYWVLGLNFLWAATPWLDGSGYFVGSVWIWSLFLPLAGLGLVNIRWVFRVFFALVAGPLALARRSLQAKSSFWA